MKLKELGEIMNFEKALLVFLENIAWYLFIGLDANEWKARLIEEIEKSVEKNEERIDKNR